MYKSETPPKLTRMHTAPMLSTHNVRTDDFEFKSSCESGSDKSKDWPVRYVLLSASCACLNSSILGYDIGVVGGAMVLIRDEFNLSDFQWATLISIVNLVAILGAVMSGCIASKYGRTRAILISTLLFFLANSVMATSVNFAMLLAARILNGLGLGFGLSINSLYIAEMSPPRYRGGLVSLSEMSINIGITFCFFVIYFF